MKSYISQRWKQYPRVICDYEIWHKWKPWGAAKKQKWTEPSKGVWETSCAERVRRGTVERWTAGSWLFQALLSFATSALSNSNHFFLIQLSVSISLKSFLIFLFGLLRTFVCIHFSIFCLFHGYSHSLSFHKSLWHLWIDHPSLIIYNQILLLCQIYSIYVPFTTFIASLWTNKIRYRVGSIKKKKYQFCIWKHLFPFISLKHGYILKLP